MNCAKLVLFRLISVELVIRTKPWEDSQQTMSSASTANQTTLWGSSKFISLHRHRLARIPTTLEVQHPTPSLNQTRSQAISLLQWKGILCPVPGLVLQRCSTAHIHQLSHYIQPVNPTEHDLCKKIKFRIDTTFYAFIATNGTSLKSEVRDVKF